MQSCYLVFSDIDATNQMKFIASLTRMMRWILVCVAVSACLEPYNTALTKQDFGVLVVEVFFVPNDTTKIKLPRTVTIDDAGPLRQENTAVVEIENEQGGSYILASSSNGLYILPPVQAHLKASYRLRVHTSDGSEYVSDFEHVESTHVIDSVTWGEEHETDDVIAFQLYAHDLQNATQYYYWTYETWQYASSDFSVFYFENGQIIPRHQYGLSAAAFSYWQMTKKNSENLGRLFDPLPDQPRSNIICSSDQNRKVAGYFGASLMQSKRVFFTRQQLKGPAEYQPTGYELCPGEIIVPGDLDESHLFNKLIAHAVYDRFTGELIGYAVARKECIDCRYHGGSIVKPANWPETQKC